MVNMWALIEGDSGLVAKLFALWISRILDT